MKRKADSPLVSIIVPVFNEEEGISWFHDELAKEAATLPDYSFEIIYVEDGSQDNSLNVLLALKPAKNVRIKVIEFSRNFGKEAALSAGISASTGDAVLAMDADGQHPIECIDQFISKWQEGADVVVGVRGRNEKEGLIKRYGSRVFYASFNKLTGVKMIPKSTDYRLLDRKVVDEFNKLRENNRITRGLIDWLGYRREFVYFDAKARQFGTAGYTFKKLFQLAMNTFVSLSAVPLFLAGYMGIFFMAVGLVVGLFVLIEQVLLNDPLALEVTGTAMLGILITFLVGVILSTQGLIGLYIARILGESQGRPLYVVRDTQELDPK
jgi:glycosyltransferase involved in cell wall biosynthesis